MSNSLGRSFMITSFGESHGKYVGIVIDGCPAGLPITTEEIQKEIDKRKPVTGTFATIRVEEDKVEILSGVFKQHTTGAPVCLMVRNNDTDPHAYETIESLLRPGHADYTAYMKYGGFNDFRGSGRFSGRLTVGLVMAGAIARKLLDSIGINIVAHTRAINGIQSKQDDITQIRENVENNPLHCADLKAAKRMLKVIEQAGLEGDSVGGIVESIATGVPTGLGEPLFDTLEGDLAKAFLSIPAVKGVEFGAGFSVANMKGSENNDPFIIKDEKIQTLTNNAGGILGGISTGMPLIVRIAVKPTPSIKKNQETIDIKHLQPAQLEIKGRHDTCIVPRVIPVVEAMTAVVLCDFALQAGLIPRVIK
jgi:chorismate synthase